MSEEWPIGPKRRQHSFTMLILEFDVTIHQHLPEQDSNVGLSGIHPTRISITSILDRLATTAVGCQSCLYIIFLIFFIKMLNRWSLKNVFLMLLILSKLLVSFTMLLSRSNLQLFLLLALLTLNFDFLLISCFEIF